jgi:hypothetical protein
VDCIGGVIVQTKQPNGVTWAKPDYQIQYQTDNSEENWERQTTSMHTPSQRIFTLSPVLTGYASFDEKRYG